ncbi:MAG: hypothetical protein PHT15_09220, partial [Gallionellaceae bacterium]|nr:hypothetical protein [Gallionellaceae bacterium]
MTTPNLFLMELLAVRLIKRLAIPLGCQTTPAIARQKTPGNLLVMFALAVSSTTTMAVAADLLETYHAAQSQDAVIAAARAARRAGQEKLAQGRSLLLPSV